MARLYQLLCKLSCKLSPKLLPKLLPRLLKVTAQVLLFTLLAKMASFSGIWIGHIVGSYTAHFSLASCMPALIGYYGGLLGILIAAFFSVISNISTVGIVSSLCSFGSLYLYNLSTIKIGKILAYTIPGMCAALCWANQSDKSSQLNKQKVVRYGVQVFLPLLCMVLFIAHPVGFIAAPYSFYWLIPVGLTFFRPTIWRDALISSFVAHAVGSVIWIYMIPMSAAQWWGLIPVVLFERCAIAAGMVFVSVVARQFEQAFSSLFVQVQALYKKVSKSF